MHSLVSLLHVLVLCQLLFLPLVLGTTFGYDEDDGPHKWPRLFKECGGKYQSPINIEHKMVKVKTFRALQFHGFDQLPLNTHIKNNGHSVEVRLDTDEPIQISGGPLHRNSYTLEQMHFHWGRNDSVGSENTINGHPYPMEVHLVFFKTIYGTFANALKSGEDALTVLALLVERSEKNNRAYAELFDHVTKVNVPSQKMDLPYPLPLYYLLPNNTENYYTYHGSLTTPPCLEVVTWIEFTTPIPVSHQQLEMIRKLYSDHGPLAENYRPVQELHGRTIYYNERNSSPPLLNIYTNLVIFVINCLLIRYI
ncbi:putative carbonic anhydrase 3 [Cimex lectularius]|uniref:Carbonic anhydrase n=1 Tax=Cimex lectularius TaxID=79782 RepID=A0A8I6RFZ0_CIMLE|nr:putative carbonic anhydrase 3 [Cimex lectularius]